MQQGNIEQNWDNGTGAQAGQDFGMQQAQANVPGKMEQGQF